MIHDPERCTGCRTCQMVCSLVHEGECGPFSRRLSLSFRGPEAKAVFTPECDGCARCTAYCPYRALEKGVGG